MDHCPLRNARANAARSSTVVVSIQGILLV
jgi:hypothetical protein